MQTGKRISKESNFPVNTAKKELIGSNDRSGSNSPEQPLSYTLTQATEPKNGATESVIESPLDLNLKILRQSLRCSIDPDLNPIAEEIYP